MSIATGIGKALDKTIGIFSPEAEAKRKFFRAKNSRSDQYKAAKTTNSTGGWVPTNVNINDIIGGSSATVKARIRQLTRDFPYFANAIDKGVEYVVGEGILHQAAVTTKDGSLDKSINDKIESAFNFWADEADISGKLHLYELMQLTKRQDLESGEFLIVKRKPRRRNSFIPFSLQIFETDWLSDLGSKPSSKNNIIDQGVEYHAETGEVLAYHLVDPDGWGKTLRIKAEHVIHKFKTLRPGQLRGISPFTPAVIVANDLSDYMDAEIDAAKLAAKYLAFVKTPDPYSRQSQGSQDPETGALIEELENGIIEYLRPGEDVTLASNPRPSSNLPPFVKLLLCMISVTTGIPYELLSADYTGVNYTTLRTSRNDFSHSLKPIAARHIRHFAMEVYRPFIEVSVLSGKLNLPGYFSDPYKYLAATWQPPGMESIDPLRETKARIDEVSANLRSPLEIMRSRGKNPEDVYREIALAKKLAGEHGLSVEEVSTALANNPAAITGSKS